MNHYEVLKLKVLGYHRVLEVYLRLVESLFYGNDFGFCFFDTLGLLKNDSFPNNCSLLEVLPFFYRFNQFSFHVNLKAYVLEHREEVTFYPLGLLHVSAHLV